MATASKIKIANKTVGWTVLFSHTEAEALAISQVGMPQMLAGMGPNARKNVLALLMPVPRRTGTVLCAAGGHHGVKAAAWSIRRIRFYCRDNGNSRMRTGRSLCGHLVLPQ